MAQYLDYNGLKEYNKLIKQHIENVKEKVYKHTFTKNDWKQIDYTNTYYIDIPKSTHGIENPYVSDFYVNDKPSIPSIFIYTNKTVNISTNTLSNGFLIIRNKEN